LIINDNKQEIIFLCFFGNLLRVGNSITQKLFVTQTFVLECASADVYPSTFIASNYKPNAKLKFHVNKPSVSDNSNSDGVADKRTFSLLNGIKKWHKKVGCGGGGWYNKLQLINM